MSIKKIVGFVLGACLGVVFCSGHANAAAVIVNTASELTTAIAAGGEIQLGADISLSSNLFIAKTVKLDLNGHALNTGSSVINPYGNSVVTILDSGADGRITGTSTYPIQVGASGYTATVILESGKIEGTNKAVRVLGGEFIMNGGEISAPGSYIIAIGNTSGRTGKFTLNDGKITGTGQGFNVNSGSELVVNGGEISMSTYAVYSKGSVVMNDGVIKTTNTTDNFYTVRILEGGFEMNGGEIRGSRYLLVQIGSTGATVEATMRGGLIAGGQYGVEVKAGSKFTMDDGKITGNCFLVYDSGEFVMNGGKIVASAGVSYSAVRVNPGGNIEMNGGEIESTGEEGIGIALTESTGVINGGKITATSYEGGAISAFKDSDITITGGELNSNGHTLAGNGSGTESGNDGSRAKFTITGGTLHSADGNAIYNPQREGMTEISGGSFVSDSFSALEIRAGKVRITGGEFTSNSDAYEVTDYTNGSSTKGAAVAISQHTTQMPIELYVCGGKFTARVPFSESNPLGNSEEAINKISIAIGQPCGELEFISTGDSTVLSEDFTGFISGGIYTHDVSEFVADPFESIDYTDNRFIVVKPYTITATEVENGSLATSFKRAGAGMTIDITATPADGCKLESISAVNSLGEEITVTDSSFTMPSDNVVVSAVFAALPPEPEPQPTPKPAPTPEPAPTPKPTPESPDTGDAIIGCLTIFAGCCASLAAAWCLGRRR